MKSQTLAVDLILANHSDPISEAMLNGMVSFTAGSDIEDVSATLLAKGTGEGRVDLSLDAGKQTVAQSWPDGTALE